MRLLSITVVLIFLSATQGVWAQGQGFRDPLDSPAVHSDLAERSRVTGVARAGEALVAVGVRGHILRSSDGQSWEQMTSPVSVDLVSVFFVDDQHGWAVGHDGAVLHSADAGLSWERQMDGRSANALMLEYYQDLASEGNANAEDLLPEIERMAESGPVLPFLDVWFKNRQEGYIVGAFNLIFHTRDGGQTWVPLYHLTDNPMASHLYSIRGNGDSLFVAGELGLVMQWDSDAGVFQSIDVGYEGSFFGALLDESRVVVFGLRGHIFASQDQGDTWQEIETGVRESIVGGQFLDDGRMVLVTLGGQILTEDSAGDFQRSRFSGVGAVAAFVQAPGTSDASSDLAADLTLSMAGSRGLGLVTLE